MTLTRIRTVLTVAGVSFLVSAAAVDLATGRLFDRLTVPWSVSALMAALAVGIVGLAWPVRQYVKGKRRHVDSLRAATILALAKSCTLTGAAMFGLYLGMSLVALDALYSPLAWSRLWQGLAAAAAAAALSAAGRLAEWCCRLPPTDGQDPPAPPAGQTTPSPA
jgi:hypothetical protein